ncbi:hypothetical protein [Sphingomonas alba]|uniref:Uncharacterized protein n=1 Tax=Sphingomonas alba TaxID=2908208 RepID=A0ABT0RNL1_9SPHN|nr:hypothetical protein [Sphingomonas alba]MCL6684237.1 hypothetical protein [Sphingomonas alba]
MITMVDEIYDRSFQAGRAEFNSGLLAIIAGIRDALTPVMASLHRIEWDAPWETKAGPRAKA